MNTKLQSLTAICSLAFVLMGANGRKTAEAEQLPLKKPSKLAEIFNLPVHASTKPVPLSQVIEIFNELADRPDITFNYLKDGCYARAHLMNKHIISKGIIPMKVWAFQGEEKFSVQLPGREPVKFAWHVAASINTLMPDGSVEEMVIDPSLLNCPAPKEEWHRTMHASNGEEIETTPLGLPPLDREGDYRPGVYTTLYTDIDTVATMFRFQSLQTAGQRSVFPTKTCAKMPKQQQGKTWKAISAP